jgi:hypothetical protein
MVDQLSAVLVKDVGGSAAVLSKQIMLIASENMVLGHVGVRTDVALGLED